jgi:AbrB family looped-hinge helix DNA binding protein
LGEENRKLCRSSAFRLCPDRFPCRRIIRIGSKGKLQFRNLCKEQYNFYMETIVASNDRITIPSEIRRQLGIKEDTHIVIGLDDANKKIILTPITREYIHSLRGKYRGRGSMKALVAEKKREVE